ncbi:transposase [Pedobacter aquatilis]|uniref:transposase n=1 Tax=Pedobacter aquatilis TaxID=351343 RepID=UPI0025B583B3|nr:transposase [Pedobacter aquatilis]MDN3588249.1 transposase [Pedobacter aquatilis]
MDKLFEQKRHNYIEIGQIYFWTATINKWQELLLEDKFKNIIITSLTYLSSKNKIDVFAFVIMPNHVHIIWRINALNGKETPQGSFLKYTAHEFKKLLNADELNKYQTNAVNKSYEFWQRDPMAIVIYSPEVIYQKLDYIHNNPNTAYWQLADEPKNYKYSSASFYENNQTNFLFLKDLRLEL